MAHHGHMTIQTRPRQTRTRLLAALGVASLALIAASPANATFTGTPPSSDDPPSAVKQIAGLDDSQYSTTHGNFFLRNSNGP
jgi:hypothetical protein